LPAQNFYTCTQATIQIYDNFLGDMIYCARWETGTQIYNNLITGTSDASDYNSTYPNVAMQINDNVFQTAAWNNVWFAPGNTAITALEYNDGGFLPATNPSSPIAYLDYNVYTGTPTYDFGYYNEPPNPSGLISHLSLAQIQAYGLEQHSSVVSGPLAIFQDLTSYQLLPQWQTAGRYGDAVGPRVPIGGPGGLMDTSRYGPSAEPMANASVVGSSIIVTSSASGGGSAEPMANASVVGSPSSSPLDQPLGDGTAISSATVVSMEALGSDQVIETAIGATPAPGHSTKTPRGPRGAFANQMLSGSKLTVASPDPSSQFGAELKLTLPVSSRLRVKRVIPKERDEARGGQDVFVSRF
jgi:hypothetical protein